MLQFHPFNACQKLSRSLTPALSIACSCQMRCMNHRIQSVYDLWLIWIIDICFVAKSLLEYMPEGKRVCKWWGNMAHIWLLLLVGKGDFLRNKNPTNDFKNTCVCVCVLHTNKISWKENIPTDRHLQRRQFTAQIKSANGRRGWTTIKCWICLCSTKLNTKPKLNIGIWPVDSLFFR